MNITQQLINMCKGKGDEGLGLGLGLGLYFQPSLYIIDNGIIL